MTIATEVSKVQYDGDDTTVIFPYTFHIDSADDLIVIIADEEDNQDTLVLNTDYTVSGVDNDSGGNVTTIGNYALGGTPGPVPTGSTITIYRHIDILQETNFYNLGGFFPETHEDALDNIIKICQQQQEELDRCLKGSVTGGEGETPGAQFEDDEFRIMDNSDNTKMIAFQASGITTGTTRTITMPDADVDLTDIDGSAVALNTAHRTGDGSDHADVATNTTHSSGDGSDHADVATNTTHSSGDGSDHSHVALNDTHRGSDGTDHSHVGLNDTHRAGSGSDHSDVASNTAARHNTEMVDSVEFDMTGLADGEFMRYDLGSTKFLPVTIPSWNYWLRADPRFGVPESNLGDVDFRQGRDTARLYAERQGLAGASTTTSDLYISVQLPSDFAGWYAGTNIAVDVYTNDYTNNTCTISVYDDTLTVDGGVNGASITPTANGAWQTKTDQITASGASYSAGDFILIKLSVSIQEDGDYIRFANMYLRYAPTAIQ